MVDLEIYNGELTPPIQSLEHYFCVGGVSIIEAAFAHSYFVHPDRVRAEPALYPHRARYSKDYYPGLQRGDHAIWGGDGREVRLDDNQQAQIAWERYTKSRIERRIAYSVRHIWGNPWDPDFFTAGWNLCYMPFWAGMLTEEQHPHEELAKAIRQASWDLYFRKDRVCRPPVGVENPGMNLESLLGSQRLRVLLKEPSPPAKRTEVAVPGKSDTKAAQLELMKEIRRERHQSWSNIRKAARALQGLAHEDFRKPAVKSGAESDVRRIRRETGLTLQQIEAFAHEQGA